MNKPVPEAGRARDILIPREICFEEETDKMKWVILLVIVLVIGLVIESMWEKKKKSKKDETMVDEGVYSPVEILGEMKAKQDGK